MRQDDDSLSSTTFSLSPKVPAPPERRQGARQLATFRVGKLITEHSQELCLIRNISSGGLMAHVYSPRAIGQTVRVELKSDLQVAGEIMWIRGANIGVKFDDHIEVDEILAIQAQTKGGWRPRAPRVEVEERARMRVGAKYYQVAIRDLSQGGVKVELGDVLAAGDEAVVTINGLSPVKGVVRWYRDSCAGISFNQAIPFDEITRWLGIRSMAS